MNEILVAGGSGLIGSKLINNLKQKNYKIVLLSTQKNLNSGIETHYWNPSDALFPALDLKRFSVCFNFCGAGIFDRKINEERKKILLSSRIDPIQFLLKQFQIQNVRLPQFISASAMGYYENICLNELTEDSTPGNGFISELVRQWENAALSFQSQSERVCILRISNVLTSEGGFLSKLSKPIRWFAGAVPGKGDQMQSWIHIEDLCGMLEFSMVQKLDGIYNAAAPEHVSIADMTKRIAKKLRRPLLLPGIPAFALKLVFGQIRADLLMCSLKLNSEKLISCGFKFRFGNLNAALDHLLIK